MFTTFLVGLVLWLYSHSATIVFVFEYLLPYVASTLAYGLFASAFCRWVVWRRRYEVLEDQLRMERSLRVSERHSTEFWRKMYQLEIEAQM